MQSPEKLDQALATLIRLSNSGATAQALTLGLALLEQAPEHPALHQLLAHLCLTQGQAAKAWEHIRLSLERRPGHLPSRLLAARAAEEAGLPDQALDQLQAAHALAPEDPALGRRLAAAWLSRGLSAPAGALLQKLIRQAPDDAANWYEWGRLQQAAGARPAAKHAFEEALRCNDRLGPAWFALALVQQDLRENEAAARSLRRLLALEPGHDQAWVNLGLLQQALGRCDEALLSYARAYALQPASFGRIAHALCSQPHGRIWLQLDGLRQKLQSLQPQA